LPFHFFEALSSLEVIMFSLFGGRRRSFQTASGQRSRYRPSVEGLERRVMPANVTGQVKFGVLSLVADSASDTENITVTSSTTIPGAVTVTGNGGTTINTDPNFTFKKVRSIVIKLRGGDDTADVEELRIAGNLTFLGGASASGNNFFLQDNSLIGGTVKVVNGANAAGQDQIDIQPNVEIGKNLIVNHGAGDSLTNMANNIFIGGTMNVTGGPNEDRIFLVDVAIGGNFIANLGAGGSTVSFWVSQVYRSVKITATGGIDELQATDLWVGRGLYANLGNGANDVDIDTTAILPTSTTGTHIGGGMTIITGSGADTIDIGDEKPVFIGGAVVLATGNEPPGPGDQIFIEDTTFLSTLFVVLGTGNDSLFLDAQGSADSLNTSIAGKLTVLGRGGNDPVQFGIAGFADTKVLLGLPPALNGGGDFNTLNRFNYAIDGVDDAVFNPVNFDVVDPAFP
jgi:hypothetical protein